MKAAAGSITPRQFWTMRVDELLGLCLGHASIMGGTGPKDDRGYEERGDGTRTYRIKSLEDLQRRMGSGIGFKR